MNTVSQLAALGTATVISFASSGLVIAALARPLRPLILDMCGSEARAKFWTIYLSTLLVLVTLLCSMLLVAYGSAGTQGRLLERTAFFALAWLTGTVVVIGWTMWRSTLMLLRMGNPAKPSAAAAAEDER